LLHEEANSMLHCFEAPRSTISVFCLDHFNVILTTTTVLI